MSGRTTEPSAIASRSGAPLVSIVIPCWNAEAFVGEAIGSALAQTYPNIEVIVVDDGSTDGSLDVIRSFGDRIRWQTGPKSGACAARNRGLELASGELVQFLDADDLLFPEKIERMLGPALENGPSTSIICDGALAPLDGRSDARPFRCRYENGSDPLLFFLKERCPVLAPLHWKADLDRVGGYDSSLPCCQERDLHLRMAIAGVKLAHVPERLYLVRSRPGSVSSDGLKIIEQHKAVFAGAMLLAAAEGNLTDRRREAFARAFAKDARHLVRFHDRPDLAADYYHLAERISSGVTFRAFGNRLARLLARAIGPIPAERLIAAILATPLAPRRT